MPKGSGALSLGILCLCVVLPAVAGDDAELSPTGTYSGIDVGMSFGGNDLLTHDVTGSNPNGITNPPTANLPAGDAIYFDFHVRQEIFHTGFALQAAVGYAYSCEIIACFPDTNWNYTFQRFNEDLLLSYSWDAGERRDRISAGRTWHNWNLLTSSDGNYPFTDVYLFPARGWVLEYQHGPLGIRYTNIIYRNRLSPARINSTNGSSIGVFISLDPEDWIGLK